MGVGPKTKCEIKPPQISWSILEALCTPVEITPGAISPPFLRPALQKNLTN